jgi:hypothetical protein
MPLQGCIPVGTHMVLHVCIPSHYMNKRAHERMHTHILTHIHLIFKCLITRITRTSVPLLGYSLFHSMRMRYRMPEN